MDVLQALAILAFFLAPIHLQIPFAYICNGAIAFFSAIQAGYIDGMVGSVADLEPENKSKVRLYLNGLIENSRHLGSLSGYGMAFFTVSVLGMRGALFIDALSFLLSAAIVSYCILPKQAVVTTLPVYGRIDILWKNPALQSLTWALAFHFAALFSFNACYIPRLRLELSASNFDITIFYIFQYIAYVGGTYWVSRMKSDPIDALVYGRFAAAIAFLFIFIAPNPLIFTLSNFMLSAALGVLQPISVNQYQSHVAISELRVLGTSRVALQFSAGAIGAGMASLVAFSFNQQAGLGLGFLFAIVSIIFTLKYQLRTKS
jgi:hypothetical protein